LKVLIIVKEGRIDRFEENRCFRGEISSPTHHSIPTTNLSNLSPPSPNFLIIVKRARTTELELSVTLEASSSSNHPVPSIATSTRTFPEPISTLLGGRNWKNEYVENFPPTFKSGLHTLKKQLRWL